MKTISKTVKFAVLVLAMLCAVTLKAQVKDINMPLEISPVSADGLPIQSVIILINQDGVTRVADSTEMNNFYRALNIKPGVTFLQTLANIALRKIDTNPEVKNSSYKLYSSTIGQPVIMVFTVDMLKPGERKVYGGNTGMFYSKNVRDFPMLAQTDHSELTLILNGGAGLFDETNAFFAQGPGFTQGNPIANNPAGKGVTFWGEMYLEPGIAAMTRLGKSKTYLYGAISAIISGRNTSDIYSYGPTLYGDVERLYAGMLIPSFGKKQNMTLNLTYGRLFFQLNDGFLISKFSGSANAGNRGSLYLNSRTAFQKAGLLKFQYNKWTLQGFFLQPEELFKHNQSNISYAGGDLEFNDNKHLNISLAYINTVAGKGNYFTPWGTIPKKGMYLFDPKVWISNIANTGLFLKSEYVIEKHTSGDMLAKGWYVTGGFEMSKWRYRPMLFYRYAFMQGDDSSSHKYTRFDPLLTGGLGDWVQGIDFRKVIGNGNIISHRIGAKMFLSSKFDISFDWFLLKADTKYNVGGMAPISELKSKDYGQEYTLTSHYYLSNRFMLLGIFSYAEPGAAIKEAFKTPVYGWTSVQMALFMFL